MIKEIKNLFKIYSENYEAVFSKIYYKNEIVLYDDEIQVYFCVAESVVNNINGIEFAKIIRRKNEKAVIIFLSQNFMSAVDILRKYICPAGYFLFDEVNEAVKFAVNIIEQKNIQEKDSDRKIELVSGYRKIIVSLSNVVYFVSCNKKIVCYLTNGKHIEFYGTLAHIEKSCGNLFLRCHSGYLINKKRIVFINYTQNYIELLNSSEKIPISRKYRAQIKNLVKDYPEYCVN